MPVSRAAIMIAALCLRGRTILSADLLAGFEPAGVAADYGAVSRIRFSTAAVDLPPRTLIHSPPGTMRNFRFAEPLWVIGYKSLIYDEQGNSPADNYLCHTFFGDQRVVQRQDQRMRALYSDGFTPDVRLPLGFGIPFSPRDEIHWMSMFNNRTDEPVRVRMTVELLLIRERDLHKPLRTVYSTLCSIQVPHLFYVPPRHDERQTTFSLRFDGRIHFIGTHIHPHGQSIELFNVSRQEQVWKGNRKTDRAGRMIGMQVYSSAEGYPVHKGETYRLISVYDNPTGRNVDGMAAAFIFYSLN